jgi:hypothetical protein
VTKNYKIELHLVAPGVAYATSNHPKFPRDMGCRAKYKYMRDDVCRFAARHNIPAHLGKGWGEESGTILQRHGYEFWWPEQWPGQHQKPVWVSELKEVPANAITVVRCADGLTMRAPSASKGRTTGPPGGRRK